MREFVIVYMVDEVEVGARFAMWPLHITLLPWFDAPGVDLVINELSKILYGIAVTTGDNTHFGSDKRLAVTLINNTSELQTLHEKLLEMVQKKDWNLQGRYTGKLFKPHVTQKAGRSTQGKLLIDALHIVEKQGQGYRRVIGKVDLPA